ncbi:chromosome segregation protein SMC [Thiocystis violascens]|uniref:Chromosome partition protein Smc n=1 Tax=Thiocystis violascens (strain ATCC 17096 / DSM 198 / 6111) TaxID=765911 RepID=I3YH16_THIV6|nr:chromosome segregation protein SMC [Thiocystis violascens]AFL76284.1 chromosome segregation protein SMC [Thiocystis violascens DSM 198]
MRLEKIRLAGFKSFVDPTTVSFPSNLVGVVGPNGCGKSNVIDAVRWVMGESSAKMLRGESMADVIFNGSTGRKPVGVASIELVFDNSDGGVGGEYAAFNQIAVKRQVSRDGQSGYFLNGSRCRRRDIQDLFLGTGLGPRSYAIIEQGMITRIIESRPEDLRLFLEEAAGISKYKERRRETETRIRHTRENLDRLDDLREEVGKQLQHLERQAATAEKYTQLRADERRLDLELKALRWRALDVEIERQERLLAEAENATESGIARQRRLEADIEARREDQNAASDSFNEVQGRFYAVGAEIARAEQAIQFAAEARGRREAELVRLEQELYEAERHLERDQTRLTEIAGELARDEPEWQAAEQALGEAVGVLMTAEDQLKVWESEWDAFNQASARPAQQAQVERARMNALEQRVGRDRERLRRIEEEAARLDAGDVATRIEELTERELGLEEQIGEVESHQQGCAEDLERRESALRELADELDRLRTGLQESRGRLASLSALQEAALADRDGERAAWLARQGLAEAPRLVDHLEVDAGWETAVETLLGDALRAVGTTGLDRHGTVAEPLLPGLVLLDTTPALGEGGKGQGARGKEEGARELGTEEGARSDDALDTLVSRVRAPWSLASLLGGVRVAEGLADALDARETLGPGERLITREGVQVGRNWLGAPATEDGGGVLARADAVKSLRSEIADLLADESALLADAEQLRAARAEAEQSRLAMDQQRTVLERELSSLRAELSSARTRREHQQERLRALADERLELDQQTADAIAEMEETRERLHEHLAEMDALAERRDFMVQERDRLRSTVAQGRERERACRERSQGLRVSVESNRAARAATQQSLTRADEQQTQLSERRDALQDALEEDVEPLLEQRERLDEHLALRVEVEQALGDARNRRESLDAEVRGLEQERLRVEQGVHANQRGLDALRLERQERLVRRRTLEEQLAESDTVPAAVLASMDDAARAASAAEDGEAVWQEELSKVGARIQRLGAINLAAIDEFKEQSQRKTYLDAQHEDITRSLETLEQAIRKIDRETRHRFKETYDRVDQGFREIFPRLFGGGQAYLTLTDEDLLETGVSVMARPPGKRNSTIHLLSGGEKALTAVALVFAIFQLNPAPFCMLDEVDAPLDDANVVRFCELVRSMSERVQFIFISHNKVTMEIADHLLGVTMHEPGVSRLVSVDVDEAVRLAAVS